ncbi:MAG: helix-turn-helix transcriptional regulator [Oscillospiraceae bacterium]|nr:helix-turn-helix transcriptional regulator [Oscillospiraceae bacterium]
MDKARFLENLKSERKKRGLTQSQVAEALGISDKTYSKWETGENEPDVDALCRLGAFYGAGPALFFRSEADESELAGMPAAAAGQLCWRRTIDLLMGLRDAAYPPQGGPEAELPSPEMPGELRMPGSDRNVWHYSCRDLLALIAAGPDANLALLMLPHEERYRWLTTAGSGLEALFRLLGLPGAMRCIFAMLTEKRGSLFTPAYLAARAGVTEEEAAAFLSAAEPWQLCADYRYYQKETPEPIYSSSLSAQLLGLLTLARIVMSGHPQWGSRGLMCAGHGYVALPPDPMNLVNLFPAEKGEEA